VTVAVRWGVVASRARIMGITRSRSAADCDMRCKRAQRLTATNSCGVIVNDAVLVRKL